MESRESESTSTHLSLNLNSTMTRFQEEWLSDPVLRDWVVKVTNDESKVYCRWCTIVLRAHKSDLTGHSNTQKHAKNAVQASVTGQNAGPISVQIVQQDGPVPELRMRSPKKNDKDPMFGSTSSTPGRPQYTKRYRKEWEELDELKSWLRPYESDSSKAYCRFCNCVLRAHRHDLVLHAKSSRHKRTEYSRANGHGHVMSGQMGISVSDGEMDVSTADSTDHDLSELEAKRARLEDVAIEHIEIPGCVERVDPDEHYGQISIMTTCDDGKQDGINVIKVEKADSYLSHMEANGLTTIQPIQTRRRKLNAAKVIQAIQNNEFTGYELLQIVKCAVPRL